MLIAITGVSRGLGRAMAKGFAAEGHTVCGCARTETALFRLREELGASHAITQLDVSNAADVEGWADSVVSDHGVPDLLVNCAALMNRSTPLWELTAIEFSDIVDVNFNGVFNTIRHFVPAMVERGSGVIVNFSSYWGRSTAPDVAAYCATKWAIEGLSRGLADDLPSGLAAVALNPGVINTEMLQSCFGDAASAYPSAEEWAKSSVPFILGLSANNNGQSLTVPGY